MSMSFDNVDYYRLRAQEERERAANADSPEAAEAHRDLAGHYEALVQRADMLPKGRA